MARNVWKLYLMAGVALPLAAQEGMAQQDELLTKEVVYAYEESIAHPEDEREYRSTLDDSAMEENDPAANVIEKIGKVALQSQLIPFGLGELSEDELRALTREHMVRTEYGRLAVLNMKRNAFLFDQMPTSVRPACECFLFELRSLRSPDEPSMTLGEVFDLGCECALELHEATTALLPGVHAQSIAAVWGFYVPSIIFMRWLTDDISESQVREIIAVQKQVLNRFVMTALPHLCTMWIRLAPMFPQIREALQEPASHLMLDLQGIVAEIAQERGSDSREYVDDFGRCECSYHSEVQDRASEK